MIVRHDKRWAAPAPLWDEARELAGREARAEALGRPTILRFASDRFMDELAALLERDPSMLPDLRAVYETWRSPAPAAAPPPPLDGVTRRLRQERSALPGPTALNDNAALARRAIARAAPTQPAKLYHPAAERFYLVAACLVCETPGLPDHAPAGGEQVSFLMRRLRPRAGVTGAPHPATWQGQWDEEGLVNEGGQPVWRPADARGPLDGEERLPLFGMSYLAEDGRRRRLLAGLVPVARRDAYLGATRAAGGAPSAAPVDGRLAVLRADVVEVRAAAVGIRDRAVAANNASLPFGDPPTPEQKIALTREADDQIQVVSWYALLDLSAFLGEHVPYVRQAIGG
ncbi:MAG: hypothetical protein N2378_04370, partial [Chloroflexaceae bacterium]|nr:hypothetical protein [Chloroflexaceae bacterium]